ncbi:isocitrate lyase/PEP mutase family protein [Hydrogenophaga crassostreae]|nr:isocitrate lyase/phosphoenolpyruvate mutase family protein [Hydrogenophaga crassostreae]
MPNAWDAGSARMLSAAGFLALGTTSAGIAYALGRPDGCGRVSREEMMDAVHLIAGAVSIPVSADLESGLADDAQGVATTIRLARDAGVVGANIEDATGDSSKPFLYDLPEAADRIRAAVEAGGPDFTLTARSDACMLGGSEALSEAVQRCAAYFEAGASCVFVPGLRGAGDIARLVRESPGPVSVVMGLSGSPMTQTELRHLGVRRVSTGGSLARAALGMVQRAAIKMMTEGSFDYAAGQIPDAELCQLFASSDDQVRHRIAVHHHL